MFLRNQDIPKGHKTAVHKIHFRLTLVYKENIYKDKEYTGNSWGCMTT
jgi:hypothetical protein